MFGYRASDKDGSISVRIGCVQSGGREDALQNGRMPLGRRGITSVALSLTDSR
jgi:hypothetical protein